MEGSALIPELVNVPTVVVQVPIDWYRLVPILLLATFLVALVSEDVMVSFLPVGFSNSGVEIE